MSKQYCFKCRKMVEPKNYGTGEFCSQCFTYFNGGPTPSSVTREAIRDEANIEILLREAFGEMGLSENAAKTAAKGRGSSELPGEFDEAKFKEVLTETFKSMGYSESAAKNAAKGRN